MSPEEATVWEVWRGYHPRADATPPKPQAKMIAAAVRELGADRVALLVAWAHEAPHERAKFLRGEDYAPGRTGAYLGLQSLLVAKNLLDRDAWAAEWSAAGKPHYTNAASTPTPGGIDPIETRLRELIRTRGDPALCTDPERAGKFLRVWVGLGGDPTALANLPYTEQGFAVRDWTRRLRSEAERQRSQHAR